MLFNSHEFIFFFLPITLSIFFLLGRLEKQSLCIAWLVFASLFFYGWWNPAYLALMFISILVNYSFGTLLGRKDTKDTKHKPIVRLNLTSRQLLIIGIAFNLGLLGYFKYANFFVENLSLATDTDFNLKHIILPLAISFFTFQQIAYLVDSYKGETKEYNFLNYCLFVTFFPQLIAGPIVHHKEMLPQFENPGLYKFNHEHLSVGATIFFIGLFKKVVIADNIAVYASPVFATADQGGTLYFIESWQGALAYTSQLYFDFSGYSDMAIGLARMFGVTLPMNFNSPYKSKNISEFWRRWHMTLSRFLRDYLYIALGGNRKGHTRRYANLFITMLLGGLWHGAGWTYVAWGALHGLYLIINHAWQWFCSSTLGLGNTSTFFGKKLAQLITFLAVVVAWVFFRAESFSGAIQVLSAMAGSNGIGASVIESKTLALILLSLLFAWLMPNTQELMHRYSPTYESTKGKGAAPAWQFLSWQPNVRWAIALFVISATAIDGLSKVSEFLYFQF